MNEIMKFLCIKVMIFIHVFIWQSFRLNFRFYVTIYSTQRSQCCVGSCCVVWMPLMPLLLCLHLFVFTCFQVLSSRLYSWQSVAQIAILKRQREKVLSNWTSLRGKKSVYQQSLNHFLVIPHKSPACRKVSKNESGVLTF